MSFGLPSSVVVSCIHFRALTDQVWRLDGTFQARKQKGNYFSKYPPAGELHGQRSLAGYSPWGCKELDVTELLTLAHFYWCKIIKDLSFQICLTTLHNKLTRYNGMLEDSNNK